MKTDFDFSTANFNGPVAFRPNFNEAKQTINVTQAWSMFFTAGNTDAALGFEPELGKFFTNITVAIALFSIFSSVFLIGTI